MLAARALGARFGFLKKKRNIKLTAYIMARVTLQTYMCLRRKRSPIPRWVGDGSNVMFGL